METKTQIHQVTTKTSTATLYRVVDFAALAEHYSEAGAIPVDVMATAGELIVVVKHKRGKETEIRIGPACGPACDGAESGLSFLSGVRSGLSFLSGFLFADNGEHVPARKTKGEPKPRKKKAPAQPKPRPTAEA